MYSVGKMDHPECGDGEVLLCGIFHFEEVFQLGYNSVRVGVTMHDRYGEVIPEQYPVFVSHREYRLHQ